MTAMAIRTMGTGRDVLLVHGLPSPPDHLVPLARAIATAGGRAHVVDLPGYGRSPAMAGEYTMARALAALEDALLDRGIRDLDVVGYSGGAYRAFGLALSGRVRVGRVVALAGMAGLDAEVVGPYLGMADALDAGVDFGGVMAARLLSPAFARQNPDAAAEVNAWIDAAPRAVIAQEMRAMARAEDLRLRLPRLSAPVLARVGSLDLACPPPWSAEIAALAPAGSLQIVEGCGHALLLEDGPATVDATCAALGLGAAADTDPLAPRAPVWRVAAGSRVRP